MRYLIVCLLISLAALLIAAAASAIHILMKRREMRSRPHEIVDPVEETDLKP